ncbi:transglycosylase SLT domain-containing protein [Yersinia enterocolitica]|uniref:transglycosylase SLT domain-containing protein n=1 Tax=Yersinia enterocolitica TaxID=630 RepID=UPI00094BB26E|nr:transglycosylase SLT domain-containing protein [Yersinia enterocolitica]HEN3645034.1 transglycosylase SLT domain-containing protein [Yersinia enterocolitica]
MKVSCLIFLLLFSVSSFGSDCFDKAGRDYHIDPDLLRAIAFRESSHRDTALNVKSQQEYAVGRMQIHSQNFSHLADFGITPQHLYTDGCLNIYTGTYYLAIAFKRWGVNWDAVGAYNAGFKKDDKQDMKRRQYAQEVNQIYMRYKNNKSSQN